MLHAFQTALRFFYHNDCRMSIRALWILISNMKATWTERRQHLFHVFRLLQIFWKCIPYLIITKMFSFIMFNTYKLRISQTVVRSGLGSSGGSLIKELMKYVNLPSLTIYSRGTPFTILLTSFICHAHFLCKLQFTRQRTQLIKNVIKIDTMAISLKIVVFDYLF